jgi:hypothetical protein
MKLMILVNVVLGLLYVVLNMAYYLYGYSEGYAVQWTPLWLWFYNYQYSVTMQPDFGITIPNFSFYLFWIAIAVNLCFVVILGRNKASVDVK